MVNCTGCGRQIPEVRLMVMPDATECVSCAVSKPYRMYAGELLRQSPEVDRQLRRALTHVPAKGLAEATEAPMLQVQAERMMYAGVTEELDKSD